MKKAFLVDFSIRTRVIVDIDDNLEDKNPQTNDGLWGDIVDKAEDKVGNNSWDYICYDNVTEVIEDTECPYGTFYSDKNN